MKSFYLRSSRKKLPVLSLVFALIIIVASLLAAGCESKSDRFKKRMVSALEKAEAISVFGISHSQSGTQEILRKTVLRETAGFNDAVEALTNANAKGTVSQVPFETTVYITSEDETLMKIYYCVVDGRMSESQKEDKGVLIIPWEFRSYIRTNR